MIYVNTAECPLCKRTVALHNVARPSGFTDVLRRHVDSNGDYCPGSRKEA